MMFSDVRFSENPAVNDVSGRISLRPRRSVDRCMPSDRERVDALVVVVL